jgi:hypothetical protein
MAQPTRNSGCRPLTSQSKARGTYREVFVLPQRIIFGTVD